MHLKRDIVTGLQLMLTPEALVPFFFGAIALGIVGNAAYDGLLGVFGGSMRTIGMIAGGSIAVMIGCALVFARVVNRVRQRPPLPGKSKPTPRKGLIVLVSNPVSLKKAVDYHAGTLEHCWFVVSAQSRPKAEPIEQSLQSQNKATHWVMVDDVYDPIEIRNKISGIYDRLPEGISEPDVILDFTGMTSVASVGSVLACLNSARPIQYTPPVFNATMQPVGAQDPIEITLDYELLGVPEP
jgi:hypothetical protein